jgi:C-terminal processing protease CtpA/Prc
LRDFNYNDFVGMCFQNGTIRAGKVQEQYQQAIRPVSGMIGMLIVSDRRGAKIERTFKDFPGDKAGLSPGDIITKIDSIPLESKNREDILDLLAGESGKTIRITYLRNEEIRSTELTLK